MSSSESQLKNRRIKRKRKVTTFFFISLVIVLDNDFCNMLVRLRVDAFITRFERQYVTESVGFQDEL